MKDCVYCLSTFYNYWVWAVGGAPSSRALELILQLILNYKNIKFDIRAGAPELIPSLILHKTTSKLM